MCDKQVNIKDHPLVKEMANTIRDLLDVAYEHIDECTNPSECWIVDAALRAHKMLERIGQPVECDASVEDVIYDIRRERGKMEREARAEDF